MQVSGNMANGKARPSGYVNNMKTVDVNVVIAGLPPTKSPHLHLMMVGADKNRIGLIILLSASYLPPSSTAPAISSTPACSPSHSSSSATPSAPCPHQATKYASVS
jgi:hypothetical protein